MIKLCLNPITKKVFGNCNPEYSSRVCCLCIDHGENYIQAIKVLRWINLLKCDGINSKKTVLEEMQKEIKESEEKE